MLYINFKIYREENEYLETVKNEEGFEKDVENMKNISLFELNLESSSLKKKNDLVKHKEKILELSSKVNELNRNYEKLLDKDVILAFKIATMAHFSYGEKIKYGYLLDKKTLATRTFPHDPDKKASQEEIQKKWDLLKSFAANSAKRTD
ncbi:hypothetical protein HHI36_015968 [Cryptolaemus montrouzieri]|uniref:Uncharacterized protein n=1 Tax=Cryptolaemus montrouzieri TaxID=559131 RepID=A0ABD2N805_9CUCU